MARWEPDASGRLQQAAMDLYLERGYEQTTVAEIAKRAGLTERTFFRYFADKREVLFWRSEALQDLVVSTVLDAPASASALEAVAIALDAVGEYFEPNREHSTRRQAVIVGNSALRERELIKLAALADATAEALRRRGVGEPAASLVAEAGMAVFKVGFEQWVDARNKQPLAELMRRSLAELRAATG